MSQVPFIKIQEQEKLHPQMNILVVEDDPGINSLLEDIFKDEGFRIYSSLNAKDALDYLKLQDFDLITLDISLPDMSGNEFLDRLTLLAPNVPVIVVSANPRLLKPHHQVRAVISKPFDLTNLLSTVRMYTRPHA